MRLLYCFWNKLGEFQVPIDIPVSYTEVKPCEFSVKILYRECRELATNLCLW